MLYYSILYERLLNGYLDLSVFYAGSEDFFEVTLCRKIFRIFTIYTAWYIYTEEFEGTLVALLYACVEKKSGKGTYMVYVPSYCSTYISSIG